MVRGTDLQIETEQSTALAGGQSIALAGGGQHSSRGMGHCFSWKWEEEGGGGLTLHILSVVLVVE